MKPNDILQAVAETLAQRGDQNGYDKGEERSAAKMAAVFNAITGKNLTESDAWLFLMSLKLVRIETQISTGRGDIEDSCKDLIGYAALRAESLTKIPDATFTVSHQTLTSAVMADVTRKHMKAKAKGLSEQISETQEVAMPYGPGSLQENK